MSVALKALPWFSAITRIQAIFLQVLRVEPGWGKKMERFLEKLKRVSGWALLVGGDRALRDAEPSLIKPRSRSKVNKPEGVKLGRRVWRNRGVQGRELAYGCGPNEKGRGPLSSKSRRPCGAQAVPQRLSPSHSAGSATLESESRRRAGWGPRGAAQCE